jgi:hypothetical protein
LLSPQTYARSPTSTHKDSPVEALRLEDWVGGEKLVFSVKVLAEVEQNRGALEHPNWGRLQKEEEEEIEQEGRRR